MDKQRPNPTISTTYKQRRWHQVPEVTINSGGWYTEKGAAWTEVLTRPSRRHGEDENPELAWEAAMQWLPQLWSWVGLRVELALGAPGNVVIILTWHGPMGAMFRTNNPPRRETWRWGMDHQAVYPLGQACVIYAYCDTTTTNRGGLIPGEWTR